jgi:FtsZ-interacting cell division protein ZipA
VSRGVTTVNDGNAAGETGTLTTGDSSSSTSSDNQSPSTQRIRYAEAASAPGPWHLKESRRSKRRIYRDERDRHANVKTTNPDSGHAEGQHGQLKGASQEQLSEVYVRNIEISDDDTDESIVDNVRRYCQTKEVKALRAYVIYNRYNDYVVGCYL